MTNSIAMQRMSIEHAIPFMERDCPQIVDALKDAALTLGWIERKAELIREIVRLDHEAPAISEIVKMGANIVGARRYDEDGGGE